MINSKERKKKKSNQKYNAENEIIIGVTTNSENKKDNTNKRKNKNPNQKKYQNSDTKKNIIKKKNRKFRVMSVLTLMFIAIGGIIYYLTTPVFNIANIIIYGGKTISDDTYISLSGIQINETNIFKITENNIKRKLKESAYVENIKIKRKLPNVLEIYVEEREPEYQIEYNNSYIYINNQGYILEINEEKKDIIEIIGFDTIKNEINIGQRLNMNDLIKLDNILKIVNKCKYNDIEDKITSIDVTDSSNYILNLENEKKIVYLGDISNLNERILWLKTILPKEEGNEGIIYINGDLSKDRVYFKEKE